MDWIAMKNIITDGIKRYRYALLVLLLGLGLMLIPGKNAENPEAPSQTVSAQEEAQSLDEQLANTLSQIKGAGKVHVMLTLSAGAETIYQTDKDISEGENGSSRWDTVIITGADRAQSGLISQVNPPTYLGAIIVCEGADKASVRLAIVEAVSRVTGLGANQISVLEMK